MNVTTFSPAENRRVSFLSSGISGFFKMVFSNVKKIALVILALLAAVGVYYLFFSKPTVVPSAVVPLKQSFSVVAKTQDGKLTNGKLNISVTDATQAASMLVQGQNVIVKNNKTFLIVNMEITNSYKVPLYTYPVDEFRLVGSDGNKYAPTTHQGNVEIRPESTKTSNVGFVVPLTQKRFKVEVGDINSPKTVLEFSINN